MCIHINISLFYHTVIFLQWNSLFVILWRCLYLRSDWLLLLENLLPHCFHRMWSLDEDELHEGACATDEGGGGFCLKACWDRMCVCVYVWGRGNRGQAVLRWRRIIRCGLRISVRKQLRRLNLNHQCSRSHCSCVINVSLNNSLYIQVWLRTRWTYKQLLRRLKPPGGILLFYYFTNAQLCILFLNLEFFYSNVSLISIRLVRLLSIIIHVNNIFHILLTESLYFL